MKDNAYINGLGTVTYEESFFLGKKKIYVNGEPCEKIGKKQYFHLDKEGKRTFIALKGNFVLGVTVEVDGQTYTITNKPKWYELIFFILPLAFVLGWGVSVDLVKIFPVFGGAIGGAIGGAFGAVALIAQRRIKRIWLKILVGLGIFALSVLLNHLIAMATLAALV